jgi:hypothetical protein
VRTYAFFMSITLLLGTQVASAGTIIYTGFLSGPNEVPPNASPGIGFALVTIDTVLNTMEVNVSFSGLVAGTTASHIHCCTAVPGTGTAGVATTTPTFAGFPLGVTSGTYDMVMDLTLASSYNPAFVTATGSVANAEAVLLAGLAADDAYLNIHSTSFPGGEIRTFLVATPEPGTFLLGAGSLLALAAWKRRKRALQR